MAAKPIERFVKRQIAEQGGWDRILERSAKPWPRWRIAKWVRKVPIARVRALLPYLRPNGHVATLIRRRLARLDGTDAR